MFRARKNPKIVVDHRLSHDIDAVGHAALAADAAPSCWPSGKAQSAHTQKSTSGTAKRTPRRVQVRSTQLLSGAARPAGPPWRITRCLTYFLA